MNAAVLQLLGEGGIEACTFAAVAEKAKVERSTLYRRYADRWGMMIDAIIAYAAEQRPASSLGSFREDLRLLLRNSADFLATPLGPAIWTMAAAVRAGSAPQHKGRYWQSRVLQISPIIEAASARGELSRDIDAEGLLCFALGAVNFRMLVLGEKLDDETVDRIVDQVCRLYCRKPRSVEVKPAIAAAEVE